VPIKGRHADTPWPVVDNFRRAFLFAHVLPPAARNGHPHTRVASTPLNPEQHSNPNEGCQRPARPSQPPVSPGGACRKVPRGITLGTRGASTNDPLGAIQRRSTWCDLLADHVRHARGSHPDCDVDTLSSRHGRLT